MLIKLLRVRNWNIVSKMVGVNLLILLVSFGYIFFFIIPHYEQSLIEEHKNFTVSMVDIALSIVERQHQFELKGERTKAEAEESALSIIGQINNQNGYFWIHTTDLKMVTHPLNRALEGQDLSEYRDPDGLKLFVLMNKIITDFGHGFIEYKWQKPSNGSIQSKMSYVKLFEPWGWVIGSGIYMDDLKRDVTELRQQLIAITILLLTGILFFSLYAARRVNQPLRMALNITSTIAQLPQSANPIVTNSEPQLLLQAIENMVRELKEAKDEAESSNRAKTSFLANMSHEIRTPMNGIIGMTELAMESAVSLEQKEYLQGVSSSAEHLMNLINDILDISKIEAGRLQLESIPFFLNEVIATIIRPLELRAAQKGIYCNLRISQTIPDKLIGDPLRLRQIITNLVGNAIKFTNNGGVTLRIDEDNVTDTSVTLIISVSDTGIGIHKSDLGEIFNPFVQADSSITRQFGGTGLGLSIVSQIVDMMGGTVAVSSEPGNGSTFCVKLSFILSSDNEMSNVEIMTPENQKTQLLSQALFRQLRILIVEDVPLNQTMIMRLIEKMGHLPFLASNGLEALERWHNEKFDLILMDVLMPKMDGIAATVCIRQEEKKQGNHIPIIALTANVTQEDIKECYQAGMDSYLSKPISKLSLTEKLQPYCC